MKIARKQIDRLLAQREITLSEALRKAGVSRTAFYSLVRRDQILPRSIRALAAALGVAPAELLESTPEVDTVERRLADARRICAKHPEADFQNVWHVLSLLELSPQERLERSLRRATAGSVL